MTVQNPPKILIIGAGAVGGFYGAKLAQVGARVSVVCRSDYELVKEKGIKVTSHWDNEYFCFMPEQILRNVGDYQDEADFILVATKVLPEVCVIDLVRPALSTNSSIILLQNGIHIEDPVALAFPNHHLISILAFVCVSRTGPGIIHHQDYGRLVVGDFPGGVSQKTQKLIDLWNQSGVPCEGSSNIRMERWKKLIWNAAFNPISVLGGGLDTKEILNDKKMRKLVKDVMLEVCLLAKVDGCELPRDITNKNIEATLNMRPYKTSMLLDFEAGRKMEIEAILGNAVKFAEKKSVNVPCLSEILTQISIL